MTTRLLIIEADNVFRKDFAQRMSMEHCRVYSAHRVTEVKRIIRKKDIEVVLLSLVELKREGLQILSQIKKFRPSLEVILINNSESIALSIEGMKRGAFDDFFLPLDMKSLLARIEEAAQLYQRRKKVKKPFKQRYEEMMMAISLAESGSPDLAHDYLNRRVAADSEKDGEESGSAD